MAVYKYNPVAQDERERVAAPSAGFPATQGSIKIGDSGEDGADDGDRMISKRMPYCMAMMVLLAIIYVLSRTEGSTCPPVHCPEMDDKGVGEGVQGTKGWYTEDTTPSTTPPVGTGCPTCPVCPVSSTTAECPPCPTVQSPGGVTSQLSCPEFDIGEYRRKSLANSTPYIIECKEAGEGGSQEV